MSRKSLLVVAFFSALPFVAYAQDAKQADDTLPSSSRKENKTWRNWQS